MALAPAVTDIEQLKGHPAVARLLAWNPKAVEGVKFDRDEMTIYVERSAIREACALLRDDAVFAANILSHAQEDVSRLFASKRQDKFTHLSYRDGVLGVPILADVLAYLECRVAERHGGGDHAILVASVEHLGASGDGRHPLLHYRGGYTSLPFSRRRHEDLPQPEPVLAAHRS